jgi:hypothetical protein
MLPTSTSSTDVHLHSISETKSPYGSLQFRILLSREFQPNTSTASVYRLLDRITASRAEMKPAAFRDFEKLFLIPNRDFAGKHCFQISFQELAKPAPSQRELHIDTMLRGAVFAASATQSLTLQVRRREHRATLAADLSRPPHPRRRSPLPTHGGIV